MEKKHDSRILINRPWSNIYLKGRNSDAPYFDGLYYCKDGVVECTSEPKRNLSYLKFVYKGTLYMRTLKKAYSQRGLAIMAGKFVQEIILKH